MICLWKMAECTIKKKNNRRKNFLGKGMEIRLGCSTFRPPWTELNVDALSDCLSGRNWAPLRIGVGLVTGKLNVEITFSNGTWNLALFQCAFWRGLTIHYFTFLSCAIALNWHYSAAVRCLINDVLKATYSLQYYCVSFDKSCQVQSIAKKNQKIHNAPIVTKSL